MDAEEKQRLTKHFDYGFRELQLRDLDCSDRADIRMGTFIQAAAFVDALALAYSAGMENAGKSSRKWQRFVERYFPDEYAPVAAAYEGFRCHLLHNFSAAETLAFTHDDPGANLHPRLDGRLVLDRGSFVAAVTEAFERFQRDVFADDALAARVLAWLDRHPPLGFWAGRVRGAESLTAGDGSSDSSETDAPPPRERSSDRPRSAQPKMAPSIKRSPKKPA